jgi:hypothetical protein
MGQLPQLSTRLTWGGEAKVIGGLAAAKHAATQHDPLRVVGEIAHHISKMGRPREEGE